MNVEEAFKRLWWKRSQKLDEAGIREILAALEGETNWPQVFVLEAMRDAPEKELKVRWATTLGVLQANKSAKSVVPTEPEWLLRALQAATVSTWAGDAVLVALAREGSEASRDALIADFEHSRAEPEPWMLEDRLKKLKKHAKTLPLLAEFCERHEKELERRRRQ